jgi:hypothetical protein
MVGILTETDLLRHLVGAESPSGPELVIVSYPWVMGQRCPRWGMEDPG